MPTVKVSPDIDTNLLSHDVSLSDGTTTVGLIYAGGANSLQRVPMTEPVRQFTETQQDWTSGRGRKKFRDDPMGYFDANAWTMTSGKLFSNPQWKFATGVRTADSTINEGSVSWERLVGTKLALAQTFTASASYSADKAMMLIRRVGNPGTLTFKLAANNATPNPDEPGTVLQTVTKTTSDITDYLSVYEIFDWSGTQALTSGTAYWVYMYGATTDNDANHWEVAVNSSGTGALKSASGSSPTWSVNSPNFSLYYRVMDADIDRHFWMWEMDESLYAISVNADNSAPKIYINGDRGTATSGAATTLTDTNSGVTTGWATDVMANEWVRIIDGTGYGQARQITGNSSTAQTVATWGTNPASGSKYIVYKSKRFTEITGHGLTVAPTGRPTNAGRTTIFYQGGGTDMRRMRQDTGNANNHAFAAMTTTNGPGGVPIYFDGGCVHTNKTQGPRLWCYQSGGSALYNVQIVAWGQGFAFTSAKNTNIGDTGARITNIGSLGMDMVVGKEDSLWWMDETTPTKFSMPLDKLKHPHNCTAFATSGDTIYVNYSGSLGKLVGKTQFSDMLNFRAGYDGLPANRRGEITQILTILGWMFFCVDGGASGYSSVYAWNEMGIHEIFRGWKTGVRIRDIFFQVNQDTNPRLWIDCGTDLVYLDFPNNTTNPRLDSGMLYQHEWYVTTGIMDINAEDYYKIFHEMKLMSENLSANTRWVELDYKTGADVDDDSVGWQRYGSYVQSPADTRILDLGEITKIRFRFRGYSTSASTPPVVTMYDARGKIAEPPKYMWIGQFAVGGNQPKTLNGQKDHDPTWLVSRLEEWHVKQTKLHMNAARKLDDNKEVTIGLPADVANYISKKEWGGYVSVQIQES